METQQDGGKTRATVRWIFIIFAVAFAVLIVLLNIAPFGATVVYKTNFQENTSRINIEKPFATETVLSRGEKGEVCKIPRLVMNTNLVKFSLKVPYDTVSAIDFKMKYKGNPTELMLGIYKPLEDKYLYKPVHNSTLNGLEWPCVTSDNVMLFQKEKKYDSVDDFIGDLPAFLDNEAGAPGTRICTYFYNLPQQKDSRINTEDINAGSKVESTLRGLHKFYVYVKGEPLKVELEKWELNSIVGDDALEVKVRSVKQDNKCIYKDKIQDDGDMTGESNPSGPTRMKVEIPGLSEGVYLVELNCGDDVLVKNISSAQRYMVFDDSVFLADNENYKLGLTRSATLFTSGITLGFEAWHKEALQTVLINNSQDVLLDVTGETEEVAVETPVDLNRIDIPIAGIMVKSPDKYFSFSGESYFEPFPVETAEYNEYFNPSSYDYLITSYAIPTEEGEFLVRDIPIDMSGVEIVEKEVAFMLYAPGLKTGEGDIEIEHIEILIKK